MRVTSRAIVRFVPDRVLREVTARQSLRICDDFMDGYKGRNDSSFIKAIGVFLWKEGHMTDEESVHFMRDVNINWHRFLVKECVIK